MRRIVTSFVLLCCISCFAQDVVGSPTIRGAYTLRSVNGASPPATLSTSGTTKTEVLDDVITLNTGSTWMQEAHMRVTTNGQVTTATVINNGNFFTQATAIFIHLNAGGDRVGQINGNDLVFTENGVTTIYTK